MTGSNKHCEFFVFMYMCGLDVPCTGVPCTGVPCTGVPCTGVPCTGVPCTGCVQLGRGYYSVFLPRRSLYRHRNVIVNAGVFLFIQRKGKVCVYVCRSPSVCCVTGFHGA